MVKYKICPNCIFFCGIQEPDKYCSICGEKLITTCQKCGKEIVNPYAKYCKYCSNKYRRENNKKQNNNF